MEKNKRNMTFSDARNLIGKILLKTDLTDEGVAIRRTLAQTINKLRTIEEAMNAEPDNTRQVGKMKR